MLPDSQAFMDMLKNKDRVVEAILKDLGACEQNTAAFQKLEGLYAEGCEVNPEKVMQASAKSIRHLNDVNRRMLMLLLIYVVGGDYTSATAQVLMKMGRGDDALKEMFRQKMQGG